MGHLTIGTVYRYASTNPTNLPIIDDLPNFLYETSTLGKNKALLESGINPIGLVRSVSGARTPAILLSSSTHKQGTRTTPWQDEFDVDNGFIRYFGDNKTISDPGKVMGNRAILEQFTLHNSPNKSDRVRAVPFIFFRSVKVGTRVKGNRVFQGMGRLRSAELVTQFQKDIGYFTNYVFEFDVFDMRAEHELFSWNWISARRDPDISDEDALNLAPKSWQEWVKNGELARDKVIRRVHRAIEISKSDQLPAAGSREEKCLQEIYNFYNGKKHEFEFLALKVVANIIRESGGSYNEGWITQKSGDGGIDFVGRIDLGTGFAKVEVVVLGQAKCELISSRTNALHLARTVARLKRGWIGAFVTTNFFTADAQMEISEDKYPLITVNGLELAIQTLKLVELSGSKSVVDYLKILGTEIPNWRKDMKPEDILSR